MLKKRLKKMGFYLRRLCYRYTRTRFSVRCYFLLSIAVVVAVHVVLLTTHESYRRATSQWITKHSPWAQTWTKLDGDGWPQEGHHAQIGEANATFVILVRNHELGQILSTLRQVEKRFNHRYHYPYVFLNEVPFTRAFKVWTSEVVSSKVSYGLIPPEHWYQPHHIDEERAAKSRMEMVKENVIYGGSVSYRNMCRFNSGFFFRHELLQQYRYYWRIEPGVDYFCDVNEDPFVFLRDHDKVYGFVISVLEFNRTIPTLWQTTKEFIAAHPQHVSEESAIDFVSDDGGDSYNLCHFWSNFEIADMDFWRSEAYMAFFAFLDAKGGFYYERWGDAPIHSLGVSLFARKDQIHFFKEIGYRHAPNQHCPQGDLHRKGNCVCDEKNNFDYEKASCTGRFEKLFEIAST